MQGLRSNAGATPGVYAHGRRYRRAALVNLRTPSGWAMNQIVAQSMTGAGSATATEQSQIAALRTASLVGSNANQARLASAARSTSGVVAVAAGSKTAARSLGVILGTSATTLLRSASESLTAAVC